MMSKFTDVKSTEVKHRTSHLANMLLTALLILSSISLTHAQGTSVTGRVTDSSDGSGLPGASVLIKGTAIGTVTDIDGNFSLNISQPNTTLVFSFVGFDSQEILLGNQTAINVVMYPDVQSLSEVVVIGYGTQDRADVTGAISTISADDISKVTATRLEQALQGKAAGVTVVNNSGAPGAAPSVRIRGLGNLRNNEPLYVIDGMIAGGLDGINPKDIESFSILKDAASASIYGSRASNGVVVITTKKGVSGTPKITLDGSYGTQSAWRTLDLLNTQQYIALATEQQLAAGESAPERFNQTGLTDVTDWQDEIFRSGSLQEHNLSVSGGSENAVYRISGGYLRNEGIIIGTSFERYSFNSNTEFTVGRLKLGQSLTISSRRVEGELNVGGRSALENAIKLPPYLSPFDDQSIGGFGGPTSIDAQDAENAVANANLIDNTFKELKLLASAYADFQIMEGLNARVSLGLDASRSDNYSYTPIYRAGSQGRDEASISEFRGEFFSPLYNFQLSYNNTFGEHKIGATGVVERQTTRGYGFTSSIRSATNDFPIIVSGNAIPESAIVNGGEGRNAILSYVGRANYSYKGKYLLSASVRRDGASQFGSNNRYATFPAASIGWFMSEEGFMDGLPFFTTIKWRVGYGQTGNNNIGNYETSAVVSSNFNYTDNNTGLSGSTIRALANADLQWETTTTSNIGLDLGFLDDRLSLSLEYFDNKTEDLLVVGAIPLSLGFDSPPTVNDGTISNKGFELTASYRHTIGDFSFDVSANFASIKNEVLDLESPFNRGSFQGEQITRTEEGEAVGYFYGHKVDRILQESDFTAGVLNDNLPSQDNAAPGDILFQDIDGDGAITDDDRTNIGSPFPNYTYGLNFSVNYKSFDLSLFLQGQGGNEIYNGNRFWLEGMTRVFNAGPAVLNRWTPENTNTNIPRAITGDPNNNSRTSDRFIEDGSFTRLRNISIGYNIPSEVLDTFGKGVISNLRVYASAQNLFTITDYTGFDPEIGTSFNGQSGSSNINAARTVAAGIDRGQFPQPRIFKGGIQITF